MLLTELSASAAYKQLKKCQCKKTIFLHGKVISYNEKFNFSCNSSGFTLHINTDLDRMLPTELFNNHFKEIL